MSNGAERVAGTFVQQDQAAQAQGRLAGLVEAATIVCPYCAIAQGVDLSEDLRGRDRPAPGPPKRIGTWRVPYRHQASAGEREWPCEASEIWERINGGVR